MREMGGSKKYKKEKTKKSGKEENKRAMNTSKRGRKEQMKRKLIMGEKSENHN